jgi:hypothetical protein
MTSPAWANQARALFKEYGVTGTDIRVVVPLDADEAIFVIPLAAAAGMRELELTVALSTLLKRKVWVATDGPQWRDHTEPLDRT